MLTKFRVDGSQALIKSGIEGVETNVDKRNKCGTPFRDGEYTAAFQEQVPVIAAISNDEIEVSHNALIPYLSNYRK